MAYSYGLDESSLFGSFHLLGAGEDRPWSQQSWTQYRHHLTHRSGAPHVILVHGPGQTCPRVLFVRGCRHHHRLVHASHILPHCERQCEMDGITC